MAQRSMYEFMSPDGASAKGRWDCPKCGAELFYVPVRCRFECVKCGPVRTLEATGRLLAKELRAAAVDDAVHGAPPYLPVEQHGPPRRYRLCDIFSV